MSQSAHTALWAGVVLLLSWGCTGQELEPPLLDGEGGAAAVDGQQAPFTQEQIDANLLRVLKPTSRSMHDGWMRLHHKYLQEVEASRGKGLDLVVYGDSITEAFRGSLFGKEQPFFAENARSWQALVAAKYRTAIWSISGDKAMHLLWRLQKGEGPQGLPVKVAMVLIGTNDLGHMGGLFRDTPLRAVRAIFLGIRLVLEEVAAQAPDAKLVTVSMPPLGPRSPGEVTDTFYTWLLDSVNKELRGYAEGQAASGRSLQFADCTTLFLEPGAGRQANHTLIPDGVHPQGPGGWKLAECLLEALQRALGEGGGGDGSSSAASGA